MRRFLAVLAPLALVAALAAPDDTPVEAPPDLEALVEGHFERLYAFSALEAYRARRGRKTAEFVVYRRWREGGVDVVLDVVRPEAADKWAYLFHQQLGRPDDFFIYIPTLDVPSIPPGLLSPLGGPGRRVQRFDASNQELDLPLLFTPLREFRPFLGEELDLEYGGSEEIAGHVCDVVVARLVSGSSMLERVELAISRELGVSLRNRYLSDRGEVRRVLIDPAHVHIEEGRVVILERRLVSTVTGELTRLQLKNYLLGQELPARFFSSHNLKIQRFPKF